MSFTEEQIESVWKKALSVDGLDNNLYRKDPCGAIIMRDKYGKDDNPFGWRLIIYIQNPCLIVMTDRKIFVLCSMRTI